MKSILRKGKWTGIAPLGYKWDKNSGQLVIDEIRGPLVRKAFKMKNQNANIKSEEIREKLKELGWPVPRTTISRILTNPIYCGLIAYNLLEGEVVEGNHPPIISKEIFLLLMA